MRVKQEPTYNPVTITLETREEVDAFWDIMLHYDNPADKPKKPAKKLAIEIADWFSNTFQ